MLPQEQSPFPLRAATAPDQPTAWDLMAAPLGDSVSVLLFDVDTLAYAIEAIGEYIEVDHVDGFRLAELTRAMSRLAYMQRLLLARAREQMETILEEVPAPPGLLVQA